jgi:hypothetical protein
LGEAQSKFSSLIEAAREQWSLQPESTFFSCISDARSASSGQVVLNWAKQTLASKGDWQKSQFLTDCPTAAYSTTDDGAIVFVDDFIGTGQSLERKSKWVRERLADRNISGAKIYLVALTSMEDAKLSIATSTDNFMVGEYMTRGISGHYTGPDLTAAVSEMLNLEGLLSPYHRRKLPSFGYKKSEALYSLNETSTPNNVFPIFWWPRSVTGDFRRTFFSRA